MFRHRLSVEAGRALTGRHRQPDPASPPISMVTASEWAGFQVLLTIPPDLPAMGGANGIGGPALRAFTGAQKPVREVRSPGVAGRRFGLEGNVTLSAETVGTALHPLGSVPRWASLVTAWSNDGNRVEALARRHVFETCRSSAAPSDPIHDGATEGGLAEAPPAEFGRRVLFGPAPCHRTRVAHSGPATRTVTLVELAFQGDRC